MSRPSREQRRSKTVTAISDTEHAEAVVLDLEQPVVTVERRGDSFDESAAELAELIALGHVSASRNLPSALLVHSINGPSRFLP